MINIDNAKKVFLQYVKKYDITNGRIRLKMEHILHVADNSKMIAQNIGLDNEKVKLAELIGLFHDIGRFEQARVYDTFSDKDSGVDHAAYSLKVLYDDGWALVRASNTGPNITARFEANTKERLEEIQKEYLDLIEKVNK